MYQAFYSHFSDANANANANANAMVDALHFTQQSEKR